MTKARQRERLKRRKAIHGGDGRHLESYAGTKPAIGPGRRFEELQSKVNDILGGRDPQTVSEAERREALLSALASMGIPVDLEAD